MTTTVWMFLATATASKGCAHPAGETHALLVFVSAADQGTALDQVRRELARHGWRDAEITTARETTIDPDDVQDDVMRSAVKDAGEYGCSIVVYDEPISASVSTDRNSSWQAGVSTERAAAADGSPALKLSSELTRRPVVTSQQAGAE